AVAPIKELIEKVAQKVNPYEFDKPILGNLRQRNLTATMAHSIEKAAAYIDNHEELACEELNLALESVDEILGFTLKPNILDDIFSKFCIGK
ncbi:MAG: tRNA uridine-5-carboxymethylaminomethyl(34) synthesis GTPase MnmE, partial [Halobacteria archaeon]